MEIRDQILIAIIATVNIVASYAAYVAAPTERTMGDIYRIFYIHVPAAWVCYLTLGISLLTSILFLAKRKRVYDRAAETSAILGLVYGCVAILGGSVWANAVWGVYWNWDPRETTTLVLWMAYAGYLSLRRSIGNAEKRAVIGAVYNVLAFSTIPLSYLSIRLWQSLHPQIITPSEISITAPMIETLLLNVLAASLIYAYLLKMMFDAASLEDHMNTLICAKGGDTYGT
jgi:heme exporter protein C